MGKFFGSLILAAALLIAADAQADEEYSTGIVREASQGTELRSGGAFGGTQNANVNVIAIEIDGMLYSAEYQTLAPGGKNAAANFVVGSEVQVRVHKERQLWIMREDGKPLKVKISRREILD